MRRSFRSAARACGLAAAFLFISSCADQRATSPRVSPPSPAAVVPLTGLSAAAAQLPSVRVSEFHYDNSGTDAGEAIEISFPTGASLTGYSVVLYNGDPNLTTGLRPYGSARALTGANTTTTVCDANRSVVVLTYPQDGIQNGSPDGIALVGPSGVVEFLSYEGSFTAISGASGGPAAGMTSVDIGVSEPSTTTAGFSLQRSGTDVWSAPKQNSFGSCNDSDEPPPPQDVDHVTISPTTATVVVGASRQFTASAFDAGNAPVPGATFTWSLDDRDPNAIVASVDANGLVSTFATGTVDVTATTANGKSATATLQIDPVPPPPPLPATRVSEIHYDNSGTDANEAIEVEGPGGTDLTGWSIVLYDGTGAKAYSTTSVTGTIAARCDGRGVMVATYATNGVQNGSPDGLALVDNNGTVIEFLSYEGTFTAADGPASGLTSVSIGVEEGSSTTSQQSLQRKADGSWEGPAAQTFGRCNVEGPAPPENGISFSGRLPSDPALPVGFEDQLFATERDGTTNAVITTTFAWTSETPSIASIDANGVMHALAEGTATFRATAQDGISATYSLPMTVASASTTAQYANNTEFGDPVDSDASDDFIVRRPQYTVSYNRNRNTPNWVAYDLDATHFGSQVDRCDCFTHDPALPNDFARLTTADYTGAGSFAGYGIDRGHLARSFDRTSAPLDNAYTYYLSNIIPQAADLNQGPWAKLENDLGNFARNDNKEVFIVAGVAGSKGSVKGEGKIVIPASVWKVALIMDRDKGLADVGSAADLQVIAVIMPNNPGIRGTEWADYKVTVDDVEALSGYNLLAALPDQIEIQVESNTKPPVAVTDGPYAGLEGSAVAMSGADSSDPDGDAISYAWSFGDGQTGTGAMQSHTYAQNGRYTVTLTVTDVRGLVNRVTTTAAVGNVAPAIAAFSGATLLPGETYSAAGAFVDPGLDSWSATVNYGDGTGSNTLLLSGKTFALFHTYGSAGTFTVTVQVTDDAATSTRTQSVVVLTPAQGVATIMAMLDDSMTSLAAKLEAAARQLEGDKAQPAVNQLQAFLNELDAMLKTGRINPAQAQLLRFNVMRVIQSLT